MVAQSFPQVEGLDYIDTYAPVARMESIRATMHIAATDDLKEEVYMEQPKRREERKSGQVEPSLNVGDKLCIC